MSDDLDRRAGGDGKPAAARVEEKRSAAWPKEPGRSRAVMSGICVLLTMAVLVLDGAFPRGVAVDVLYIVPVLLSLGTRSHRLTLALAGLCSLLVVAGYFLSPPGGEFWKVMFNRGLAVAAVWMTTVLGLRNNALSERSEAALRERARALEDLRVLRGLLPICAWCKKVRNDEGYWTQIESYLSRHTEASFSHGICPECLEKHFPPSRSL